MVARSISNEISIPGSKSFSVYPNPAKTSFAISLYDVPVGTTLISIINEEGICLKQLQTEKVYPEFFNEISVTDLDEGLYFIRVTVDKVNVYYSRIVVIN